MAETSVSASPFTQRTAWTRNLQTPLRSFLQTETGGAAVLLAGAVAGLLWANIDHASYERVWTTTPGTRPSATPGWAIRFWRATCTAMVWRVTAVA